MPMVGHFSMLIDKRYNIVSEGGLTEAARKLDEAQWKAKSIAMSQP